MGEEIDEELVKEEEDATVGLLFVPDVVKGAIVVVITVVVASITIVGVLVTVVPGAPVVIWPCPFPEPFNFEK